MSFYYENRELYILTFRVPSSGFTLKFILNFCVCVALVILKTTALLHNIRYRLHLNRSQKKTSNSDFNKFDKPKDNNHKTEHSKNEHKVIPYISSIILESHWLSRAGSIPIEMTLPACRLQKLRVGILQHSELARGSEPFGRHLAAA